MIYELTNPLTKTLITHLRDSKSDAIRFRHLIRELTKQLAYEALNKFELKSKCIKTWKGDDTFDSIEEENIIVVTILRAGMPMLESVMELLPNIAAGFLAMQRDEKTHKSLLYYDRLPDCEGKIILLVDPMVATGGSMCDAIEHIQRRNPRKIITLNIIGSPEGVKIVQDFAPDVDIFISQIDDKLNDDKFIIPGLGDAGDRSYNTL
ncbi:MAG: uracil phosphoribosyltransferase [Arcobacteraceae bacterium]